MQLSVLLALLRTDAALPAIFGGTGETTTTFANVLKEVYTAQGVVDLLNVETYWLDNP